MKNPMLVSMMVMMMLGFPGDISSSTTAVPLARPTGKTIVNAPGTAAAVVSPDPTLIHEKRYPIVGAAAAVKGAVEATDVDGKTRDIKSGDAIFHGDTLSTDASGGLQLLMVDQTVFTIGPNSSMVIDEFVYDPKTGDGKLKTKALRGVFRFVTGKIAKKKPENMEIDLPSGTLGIRGTMVLFQVVEWTTTAILLGPGKNNNAGARDGGLVLSKIVDGKPQEADVSRAGFGAEVGQNLAPRVFRVPDKLLKSLQALLTPIPKGSAKDGSGGGNAADESGQSTAGAIETLKESIQLSVLENNMIGASITSAQDAAEWDMAQQIVLISEDATVLQELADLQGTATYNSAYHVLRDPGGVIRGIYGVNVNVDFDRRQVGGDGSFVTGVATNITNGAFVFDLNAQSFEGGNNPGSFTFNTTDSGCGSGGGCNGVVDLDFLNSGDDIATSVNHAVEVMDPNTEASASGSGNAARI